MFTGIVDAIGQIARIERRGDLRAEIRCAYPPESIALGASIACDGVCLTVVDKDREAAGSTWFAVDVSAETVSKTTLGDWREGRRVNLERALRVGDELGGHIVSGHVDGVGSVLSAAPEGDSTRVIIGMPSALAPFVASKGSIAIDGVSLTVNDVGAERFGVNLIPHTKAQTTFEDLVEGRRVNLEIDVLARYVSRILEAAG